MTFPPAPVTSTRLSLIRLAVIEEECCCPRVILDSDRPAAPPTNISRKSRRFDEENMALTLLRDSSVFLGKLVHCNGRFGSVRRRLYACVFKFGTTGSTVT